MPISTKDATIREIAQLIRKECITFAPEDRVKLNVKSSKKDAAYYIGDVYYDFDTTRLCYKVYNEDGLLIVPNNGPRFLDRDVLSEDLKKVSNAVSHYVEDSIYRAQNISYINSIISENDDTLSLVQPYPEKYNGKSTPEILIDNDLKGDFSYLNAIKVFRGADQLYICATNPGTMDNVNIPLVSLSDVSVSKIFKAVKDRAESLNIKSDRKVASAKEMSVKKNPKIHLA